MVKYDEISEGFSSLTIMTIYIKKTQIQ